MKHASSRPGGGRLAKRDQNMCAVASFRIYEDACFDACEAHLADLRTHHPGRDQVSRIDLSEGVPAFYPRSASVSSYIGSPAALCAGS